MASIIYDSLAQDLVKGNINYTTDSYYVLLVSSSYTPNKATDARRSAVTNEVTGTGYTAGGQQSSVTASLDTTNHQENMTFSAVTWNNATITAAAAVIYKSTGAAANDPLLAFVDFGGSVSSTAASFSVTFSSPLRLQA